MTEFKVHEAYVVQLQPGDIAMLTVKQHLTHTQREQLRQSLVSVFGDRNPVIILDADSRLEFARPLK
jgi:hypothetical protein